MKKIIALLLALSLFGALLAGCGENAPQPETPQTTEAAAADGYSVRVVDAFGEPYTEGIIVRFMQGGQQVSMQTVDANGVAAKELSDGTYTAELKFTDGEALYYYDQTAMELTPEKKSLEVVLSMALPEEPDRTLFAQGKDHPAYNVVPGCTYVKLTAGQRSYFLFTPTAEGKYEIALQGATGTVGYYGAPHFVQETTAVEGNADGSLHLNVKASMIGSGEAGTTVLVLGVDTQEDSGILSIRRIGDSDWTVEDEPWHTYVPTITLENYVHPAGVKLGEFDLTAATGDYNLVLGSDNYYHLNSADGPLVLVRLGERSGGSKYLDSFETILDHTGVNKYFFDENNEFVKKEDYSQCLLAYLECMDEATGLYPLTEDLKYIIQQEGDSSLWFDPDSSMYLFVDDNGEKIPGINNEISWLFMCCYAEQ